MSDAFRSLIECGSKVWLDSIDPDEVQRYRALGVSGATSNPIIVSDIVKTGRCDDRIAALAREGHGDESIAWTLTDELVRSAQEVFLPVWEERQANDGYVSFELDPLLEDPQLAPPAAERTRRYVELGQRWAEGHRNRMIKVPATDAGLDALEELAAAGVTLNVTLIFSPRQYRIARDAVWRGAQHRGELERFKAVFSIFVSRVDVYTEKHVPSLSSAAQGQVGILNAKRIWEENARFWAETPLRGRCEMIFASTGTKKPEDPPDKYVEAFAGSDILTNPPATNAWLAESGKRYRRRIDERPPDHVVAEIDRRVDMDHLERTLMEEGVAKFADPHKALIELIGKARAALAR